MASKVDWWERTTAVATVFIAVAALYYSISEARKSSEFNQSQARKSEEFAREEARRSEEFARKAAMPHITVDSSLANGELTKNVVNNSPNPAFIKWMAVTVEGKLVRDWDAYYERVGITHTKFDFLKMLWPGNSMLPTSNMQILYEKDGPASLTLWKARGRASVQICYCSYLEDCRMAFEPISPEPTAIDSCEFSEDYKPKFWIAPSLTGGT